MIFARHDAEFRRLAFHEAGHAIVAAHLGHRVRPISLAGPRRGALNLYTDPALEHPERPDEYAAAVRDAIAVLLAGALAEERLLGFAPMWAPKRCRSDYMHAANMAAELRTTQVVKEALIPAGERRVRRFFKQPEAWERVSRLAASLQRDHRATVPLERSLQAA